MPRPEDIPNDKIEKLKNILLQEPAIATIDREFGAFETVDLKEVVSEETQNKTPAKWASIGVRLYNFAVGEATPPVDKPDDVQYVGMCLCPRPFTTRTQEFSDTPKATRVPVRGNFGHYDGLFRRDRVYFAVDAGAFEVDTTPAWEGIVKGLGSDLDRVGQVGKLFADALPGLAGFKSPGAAIDAVVGLVKKGLGGLDDDDFVGDVTIVDTVIPSYWFRKIDKESWLARKWVLHAQPNNPAWYLSQWFIELSVWPLDEEYASYHPLPQSKALGIFQGFAAGFAPNAAADIAALRVLRGENIGVVSEITNLKPGDINSALASLRDGSDQEVIARLTHIILSKLG